MKKIFLTLIAVIIFTGCGSSEETELVPLVDIVTDTERIFSIDDFKNIGYKQSKKYKVDDLPGATSAYYGFIKNKIDPDDQKIDYEVRFYANHADAVSMGTEYVENATGEDGCISKDCALWTPDISNNIPGINPPIAIPIPAPIIGDKYGSKPIIFLSFLGQGLSVLILLGANSIFDFYLFAFLFGIPYGGEGTVIPVINNPSH